VTAPIVLAEHVDGAGITWQARIAADRGRLQVIAIVPPGDTVATIERLSDTELQQLLAGGPARGMLTGPVGSARRSTPARGVGA
jgi:hypothetical protein